MSYNAFREPRGNAPASHSVPAPLEYAAASLDEARRALEEPPAGVAALPPTSPFEWMRRRRVLSESERRISRAATQWMLALPADVRPVELLRRFARIANHLAANWHDPDATRRCLDDLLLDRRGGRQGFPPAVAAELIRLHHHFERQQRSQRRRG
jgi:hypothetical protein